MLNTASKLYDKLLNIHTTQYDKLWKQYSWTQKTAKKNESLKFVYNLSQRLHFTSSNIHVVLQNLSISYTWKNTREQYKNNGLKIIASTWSYQFELPDGSYSVSDIQGYIEFLIKKREILTAIPPIHVYVNRINSRLVFKIKDANKLELQTPEN